METAKILPNDIEAEKAVIGSMLIDNDSVVNAIDILKTEDFYRNDNKYIYEAILNLYNRGEPIDLITVKNELITMKKFEAVGGIAYLATLPDKIPFVSNSGKYIKIVEEKSLLRKLIKAADEIQKSSYEQTDEIDTIIEDAEKKIFNIMQGKNQKGYSILKEILIESFSEIENLYNKKETIIGLSTGFFSLDTKLAGLHNSDLILVAARPAMGKSAFASNIAVNVATKTNVPVAIFNLEMSKTQVTYRILCSEAMVDSNKVRTGRLDEEDWIKLATALGTLSDAQIYIDDTPGITVAEIRAKCRKLKLEKNIGLVIIDYLQLIKGRGKKNSNREQEISEISRSLKILAKEINVPVIAYSNNCTITIIKSSRTKTRPQTNSIRFT